MLNKNAICKYSTVIQWACYNFPNTFNWYLTTVKCEQRQTNKTKNGEFFYANFSELSNFSSSSFWEKPLWNQKLFLLTATARRSCYILVRPFPTLSCFLLFFTNFFGTNFRYQNKNNGVEIIRCFVYQLKKKILRILCVWTLKILFANKRILNQ